MNALSLFYRFLLSKRSDSLIKSLARLAVVATFISVAALFIVLSIMNGFNKNIQRKLLAIEPHVSVDLSGLPSGQILPVDLNDLLKGSVEELVYYDEQDLIIRTVDGLFSGAIARGLDKESLQALITRMMKVKGEGTNPEFETSLEKDEVFIGADLARSLNLYQGDDFTLVPPETLLLPSGEIPKLQRARVKGLLQTDVAGFDTKVILYRKDHSFLTLKSSETRRPIVEIRLLQPENYKSVQEMIINKFSLNKNKVETWASRNSSLLFALRLEKIAMSALLILSILVTSFSINMVLLIFISEKQKDIGLFMALGLSKLKTRSLFFRVGFYLAILGSLAGLIFGLIFALYVENNPIRFMPDVYVDSSLPAEVQWMQLFLCFVGIVLLSLFASWWPIQKALEISPSDALRGLKSFRRIR